MNILSDKWTYGLEIEMADFDRSKPDVPDGAIVNKIETDTFNPSISHATDPDMVSTTLGGEINTVPTIGFEKQVEVSKKVFNWAEGATLNYTTWIHTHIGFPEELITLENCKNLLKYSQENTQDAKNWVMHGNKRPEGMPGSVWAWYNQKELIDYKYKFCMNSNTLEDFKKSYGKSKAGNFAPITFKRSAINTYALFKRGAIEFRIFYGSLDPKEVNDCFIFSKEFILHALTDQKPVKEWSKDFKHLKFPVDLEFRPEWEIQRQKTKRKDCKASISRPEPVKKDSKYKKMEGL